MANLRKKFKARPSQRSYIHPFLIPLHAPTGNMKATSHISVTLLLFVALSCISRPAAAITLHPDTIAKAGKFPAFCMRAYSWVDRFFNSTDTAYVGATGYKMNIKLKSSSWADINEFYFDSDHRMKMQSPYCSSIGFDVQYLAIALGYDININRLMGGNDRSKSRFNFELSSALLSARLYSIKNHDGMTIRRFGDNSNLWLDFSDMSTSLWGIDATYIFNHRKYSSSAAFSFGKIQKRSQGSFLLTFAYQSQKMEFDFNSLPDEVHSWLPDEWKGRIYAASGHNISLGGGYGFNWVPCRNITIGLMAQILPSLSHGYINSPHKVYSFRMSYRGGLSAVWNQDRWFVGASAKADASFIYSRSSTLTNALVNFDIKAGWRFNLF